MKNAVFVELHSTFSNPVLQLRQPLINAIHSKSMKSIAENAVEFTIKALPARVGLNSRSHFYQSMYGLFDAAEHTGTRSAEYGPRDPATGT